MTSVPADHRELLARLEKVQLEYELDVVDKQILTLLTNDPFLTLTQLGKRCGMTASTVSRRMKKPGFRRAYDNLNRTTQEIMEQNARRAARRLGQLIGHEDEKVALKAIEMTLGTNHNRIQVNTVVGPQPAVIYRTTVQADGSLMQSVIDGELLPESSASLPTVG